MNIHAPGVISTPEEEAALAGFRSANKDLFQKDDAQLYKHLAYVGGNFALGTLFAVTTPLVLFKILLGIWDGFLLFSLINVTIHHHHTHKNAAESETAKKLLDMIYLIVLPNAPKRKSRYTRAHLNHHLRPFHETDVDHHYGTQRFLRMMKNAFTAVLYFLELTFIGAHMPGWEDDRYMNEVPLEKWNQPDYEKIKAVEGKQALKTAALQWGAFLFALYIAGAYGLFLLEAFLWGWAFPMLLVKNWAHFLGQFQHYGETLLNPKISIWKRTKTFRIPSSLNYLAGGEISGHFLHHLFPELPYYKVEEARLRLLADPRLASEFAIY